MAEHNIQHAQYEHGSHFSHYGSPYEHGSHYEHVSPRYSTDTWSGSPIDLSGYSTTSNPIYSSDIHNLDYGTNIGISGSCESVSTINIVLFIILFFLMTILLSVIFYKMNIYRQNTTSEKDKNK